MSNDKLSRFADALLEEAESKRKTTETELNQKKQARLSQAEEKLDAYFDAAVSSGKDKIRHQKQIYLTRREAELRKMLLQNRQRSLRNIFKEAEENIRRFTDTPQYADKLKKDFAAAAVYFDGKSGETICRVTEKDLELAESIFNLNNIKIEVAENDIIGGFTLENPEQRLFVDCTLASELQSEKTRFYQKSDLIIE